MDLYEYQAMELFAAHDVPVPAGVVAATPRDAWMIAARLGPATVVKAQVKTGGRGKAGGVRLASGPAEAEARAAEILGMQINGHTVRRVLVATACEIAEEYYVSFLLDRAERTFLAMASTAGGMEIEEVAATRPEALVRVPIDPLAGVTPECARQIVERAGFPPGIRDSAATAIVRLWAAFVAEDATLVEVNPLVRAGRDGIVAVDGKVTARAPSSAG
jgi:succinyl-CoA synthetase beta subunit